MSRSLSVLVLFSLVIGVPFAGRAEDPRPEGRPATEEKGPQDERSQESRKLLEEVLMARLTRDLALDEEQTVLMVRHLAEFRDRMAALRRERGVIAKKLRQAVRESQDEPAIEKYLAEAMAHEEKAAEARRSLLDIEGLELTTWQKARLYLFIQDFDLEMRRILKQAQERRLGRAQARGEQNAPESPADTPEEIATEPRESADAPDKAAD